MLVLASVTGGDQMAEVPDARINLEFVLDNKAMVGTANRCRQLIDTLTLRKSVIKAFCEIAPLDTPTGRVTHADGAVRAG